MDSVNQKNKFGHNLYADNNSQINLTSIVSEGIKSKDLVKYCLEVFAAVFKRDYQKVEIFLNAIDTLDNLDSDCVVLINALNFIYEKIRGVEAKIENSDLVDLLENSNLPDELNDLVQSILLFSLNLESKEHGKKYIKKVIPVKRLTNAVYLEYVANSNELVKHDEIEFSLLSELEAIAYIRLLLRSNEYQLSYNYSLLLDEKYNDNNSKVLRLLCCSYKLANQINNKQPWSLNIDEFSELNILIEEIEDEYKNNKDFRLTHAAAIISATVNFTHIGLVNICKKNTDQIKKVFPEIGKAISDIINYDEKELEDISTCIPSIIDHDTFVKVFNSYKKNYINKNDLKNRLNPEIKFKGNTPEEDTFFELWLTLVTYEVKDKNQREKVVSLSSKLIQCEEINLFSCYFINEVCELLNEHEYYSISCEILSKFIPERPTINPLLITYCISLVNSEQLATFETIINTIQDIDESITLLNLAIDYYSERLDFNNAFEFSKKALEKYGSDLAIYLRHAYLLKRSGADKSEIREFFDKLPINLLSNYSDNGYRVLTLLSEVDMATSQNIMLKWFIKDPINTAQQFSNFHFFTCTNAEITEPNPGISECNEAIIYSVGNKTFTKFIVEDQFYNNEYTLGADTRLGQEFNNYNAGDNFEFGFKEYRIIEKLDPFVAAVRLSIEIRDQINAGDDCFHIVKFDENDIDSMISQMEKISKSTPQTWSPFIDGKKIPLLMRLTHTHYNDLIRGSILYLTNEESNKQLGLYNKGLIGPQKIILDCLSISYLSLSGLSKSIINKNYRIYITQETKDIVDKWLKTVTSENYKTLAVNEGNIRFSSQRDFLDDPTVKNIKELVSRSRIINTVSINLPLNVSRYKSFLDSSHFSTLRACIAHSIPLFCIDNDFCSVYDQEGIDVYNSFEIIKDLINEIDVTDNKGLILNIDFSLPYVISLQNVIEMSEKPNIHQLYCSKLLAKFHEDLIPDDNLYNVLSLLIIKSIYSSQIIKRRTTAPLDWYYTENIFNSEGSPRI